MTSKHTPTPITILNEEDSADGWTGLYKEHDDGFTLIADVAKVEDARFFVRAVNNHDDLADALKQTQAILNAIVMCPTFQAPTVICDAITDQMPKNRAVISKLES